jgi:hypothetical protein
MNKTKFKDKIETQKGTYGENLVKQIFIENGYIVYMPQNEDTAHPFDLILIKRDGLFLSFGDVKTKPSRWVREDTGIQINHFKEYKSFADKYKLDFALFFVDEYKKCIWANTFRRLEKAKTFIQDGFIYWKLEDLINIKNLTDKEVSELKSFK